MNKKANVLVGRFQPFTKRDLDMAKSMKDQNGLSTVLVYIRSHQGYENTPLKSETVRAMLNELTELDLFESVTYSDTWELEDILKKVSKNGFTVESIVKSEHDGVQSQLARLAAQIGDRGVFCGCVPEKLGKYYDVFRSDLSRFTDVEQS